MQGELICNTAGLFASQVSLVALVKSEYLERPLIHLFVYAEGLIHFLGFEQKPAIIRALPEIFGHFLV